MAEKQFYAAIDLGTTNSVIAYGNITRNKMKPIVLELDRKNDTGSTSRSPLLPSAVFYYKNNEGNIVTDVGDYAKSRYGTRAGYVCKSVKSLMGITNQVPLVDEIPDKTPADVSSQILSYIVNMAKKRLFQPELSDVVITVPASFDSDQCQATIDAAQKAGINVDNVHDVLLYEPKAVIYDFMRMQEDGEIPPDLLSLETDKNIMVFDLGGGTLDVTLHKVGYSEKGILQIKDLAISRYTRIGGDNFDELLAADMLKRFEEMNGIKVSIKRCEEVMCKLRKLAEQLKVELSMAYENARMSDIDLSDDYGIDVMDISLYDAYAFDSTYTKSEVEQIIAPLMGYKYKKEDAKKIQKMDEKDVDNIIYPILDVLDKAGSNTKIDAVILNGGMTKFYRVRQRIKEFFGFEPLETSDPDLSVARGAVYYHYCLHKYNVQKTDYTVNINGSTIPEKKEITNSLFCTGTILNDSINLGLRGEYVSLLIPAGTELPYRSEEIRDKYKFDKMTNTIGIEMFLGRGTTKNLPNRRIATRTVKFKNSYPANTPLSFQIYINSLRMMTMEAWITDQPGTKTIMEMDMASLKIAEKTTKGISTIGKMKLNAKSELNELKTLADRNKNNSGHKLNRQIDKVLEAIGQASNPEEFFIPCMEQAKLCLQSDVMLGYIYTIGISFKDGWNDSQKKQILSVAKRHFECQAFSIKQNKYVLKKALELIAAVDADFIDFCTEYLGRIPEKSDQIRQTIFKLVVLYELDDAKVAKFFETFFKVSDLDKEIADRLIQRYGRGTSKENQKKLLKLIKILAGGLNVQDRKSVPDYLVILIAELCSKEGGNPLYNDNDTIKPVEQSMKNYLAGETNKEFLTYVTNIWNSVDITSGNDGTDF